jgi:hypothetical protein
MRQADERALRTALQAPGGEDPAARERAWRVVRAAYADREPVRRRRPWAAAVAALVVSAIAVAGVAAASAPDSDVGRWVRRVLSVESGQPARAGLARLPGGGRLLVQSGSSAWTVASDGAKRRLGSYAGTAWSPGGLFVIAWRGHELTALEPGGRARWSLSAPAPVSVARWGPVDGFRVAYLAGGDLRIVNGDGTGDRRYAAAARGVAPAWRPDAAHVLAFAGARGRIEVVAVDTRRRLWRSAPLRGVTALAWSTDGRRLLAAARDRLLLFARSGRLLDARATPGTTIAHLAPVPAARGFVAVRHYDAEDTGEVVQLGRRLHERRLFSAPGRFGAPAWAPDGRALLVPWPAADQWLFLRPRGTGRTVAVGHIARQFAPGVVAPPFPRSAQWCCQPG